MVLTFDLILLVLIRWCAEKKGKVPSAFRRQFVCSVFGRMRRVVCLCVSDAPLLIHRYIGIMWSKLVSRIETEMFTHMLLSFATFF